MTKAQHAKLNRLLTNSAKARKQSNAAQQKRDQAEIRCDAAMQKARDAEAACSNYEMEMSQKSIRKMAGGRKR